MTIRRFASAADADREDHAYWQQIPEAERALEAWRLSQELWRLKGGPPHESGLCRSLRAFVGADVRFMIVGAYALAVHGRPRATGDLDIWIDATPENAPRVMQALAAFGAPLGEITQADFARPGVVYQMGVPPGRIDLLTELTGLTFEQAWPDRIRRPFGELEVDFIDRASFLRNKRATGRLKDLSDIEGMA
jgi:hypothetical protein